MEALAEKAPAIRFDIFTKIPSWFFEDSLSCEFNYHPMLTDIGLTQQSAFKADLDETQRQLDAFLPFRQTTVNAAAEKITRIACNLVICDIAPMGIEVARRAGIPSVLVENFTWDWIYADYLKDRPGLETHAKYLNRIFRTADIHIQTEPICKPRSADLKTLPVSRKVKTDRSTIKSRLGISPREKTVLISTGGVVQKYDFIEKLKTHEHVRFIIPGGSDTVLKHDNLVLLPHRSKYYHPDLVNLADAVVGKVGYSTLAEVYHAGIPFGFVKRRNFRETAELVAFIKNRMPGIGIGESEFQKGDWITRIDDLLKFVPDRRNEINGARQIASFLLDYINN